MRDSIFLNGTGLSAPRLLTNRRYDHRVRLRPALHALRVLSRLKYSMFQG